MGKKKKEDAAPKPAKKSSIGDIVKNIKKKYGEDCIAQASKSPAVRLERIPCGIYGIDKLLEGGWPLGRIVQIYGKESGAKTTTLLHSIANAQRYCRHCLQVRPERIFYPGEPACKCKKPLDFETMWLDVEGCISYDSEIFDPITGELGVVGDRCCQGPACNTHSINDISETIHTVPIGRKSSVGFKDIIRISTCTTALGLTPDHKVYAWRRGSIAAEWLPSSDLRIGDSVARPWKSSAGKRGVSESWELRKARLLGYLLGDGCFRGTGSIEFTNIDDDIIDDVESILHDLFKCSLNKVDDRHYRLINEDIVDSGGERRWSGNALRRWVSDLGLIGVYGEDKHIPQKVFDSNLDILLEIASGLILTDGTVSKSRPTLSFTNASKRLVLQLREIFARVGILGRIDCPKIYSDNHSKLYRLTVNTIDNLDVLDDELSLIGYKGEILHSWDSSNKKQKHLGSERLVPTYSNKHYSKRNEYINSSDVWWDVVTGVVADNNIECFDFGVDKYHSLTIGDVIIHNCYDANWSAACGVNNDLVWVTQPDNAEDGLDIVDGVVRDADAAFVVIDTLTMLTPKADLAKSMGEDVMALRARKINRFIRRIVSAQNEMGMLAKRRLVIFLVCHINIGIGGYHPTEEKAGGKTKEYANSFELRMKKCSQEAVDIGKMAVCEAVVKKTKITSTFGDVAKYHLVTKDTELFTKGTIDETPMLFRDSMLLETIFKVKKEYRVHPKAGFELPVGITSKDVVQKFFHTHRDEYECMKRFNLDFMFGDVEIEEPAVKDAPDPADIEPEPKKDPDWVDEE